MTFYFKIALISVGFRLGQLHRIWLVNAVAESCKKPYNCKTVTIDEKDKAYYFIDVALSQHKAKKR